MLTHEWGAPGARAATLCGAATAAGRDARAPGRDARAPLGDAAVRLPLQTEGVQLQPQFYQPSDEAAKETADWKILQAGLTFV